MNQYMSNVQLRELQHRHNFLDSELAGDSVDERLTQAKLLVNVNEKCAEIASRVCAKEAAGFRCFRCRPLIVTLVQSNGVKRHMTFQKDPACAQ